MTASDTARADVVVQSAGGLDAYAAARLVQTAAQYAADIRLQIASKAVNAKRVLDVMSLDAAPGTGVRVIASGPDAFAALHALRVLFLSAFEVSCVRLNPTASPSPWAA